MEIKILKSVYDIVLSLILTSNISNLIDKIIVSLFIVIFNFAIDLAVKFIKSKLKTHKYDDLIDSSAEQLKNQVIEKIDENLTKKDK